MVRGAREIFRPATAASYGPVKDQLKRETLSRMREIIDTSSDPMLKHWV